MSLKTPWNTLLGPPSPNHSDKIDWQVGGSMSQKLILSRSWRILVKNGTLLVGSTLIAELVSFCTTLHINICAYTYSSCIHNWLSHRSTIQGMCNFYHKLLPFFLLYKSGIQVSFVSVVVISWPGYFTIFKQFFIFKCYSISLLNTQNSCCIFNSWK